jgi:peptide/nickel transport system ATP-binding protein
MSELLAVSGLTVRLAAGTVLRDVELSIRSGEALGLVGESGSGKSMTARAIARLLPAGALTEGSVTFRGRDVGGLSPAEFRRYRADVAMIFPGARGRAPGADPG